MSDSNKTTKVDIWDYTVPLEEINWLALGGNQMKQIIQTAQSCGSAVMLDVDDEGVVRAHVIPNNFSI